MRGWRRACVCVCVCVCVCAEELHNQSSNRFAQPSAAVERKLDCGLLSVFPCQVLIRPWFVLRMHGVRVTGLLRSALQAPVGAVDMQMRQVRFVNTTTVLRAAPKSAGMW